MSIVVYITSVTGNLAVKKNQQRIEMILGKEFKGVPVVYKDVASSEEDKAKMRELSGNPKALPPQLFNGDTYCGDFDAFDNANECDELETFLKIK